MTRMFLAIPMRVDEERDEQAGGKALLAALQRDLCQAGLTVHQRAESWDEDGWSLIAEHEGASVWCLIQASDDWLIECWPHSGLIDRLKGRDCSGAHRKVMDAILAALARQRPTDGARWMSEQEMRAC